MAGAVAPCAVGCPTGTCALGAPGCAFTGLGAVTGFLGMGLFLSTKALGAGLRLRIVAGPPALGVVELGPEGGVGAAELLMVTGEAVD